MDFMKGKIRPIYFRYLAAAFGSAMITSVYSVVDTAMVGQHHGPDSTAALAVVAPVWNIIYSLGLLMGIGGSVIFSTKRGSARPDGSENPYFTVSVLGSLGLALLAWAGLLWLEGSILTFFGADKGLLVLARRYLRPVKFVFPLFLFNQMLAAFLVSVARGLVLSGILILILPALRREALWLAVRKRTMDKAPTMPRLSTTLEVTARITSVVIIVRATSVTPKELEYRTPL